MIKMLVTFRERFILDPSELVPDSDLRLATNLCKGIGYIVIGNLYDNVPRPKKLTFYILACLSLATALVSDFDSYPKYNLHLFRVLFPQLTRWMYIKNLAVPL